MKFQKLNEWIKAIYNDEDDERAWRELESNFISLLKPIRDKLIRSQLSSLKLKIEIKDVSNQLMFYKEALNSLSNPIFIKDNQTQFCFFNRKYEEVFGMDSRRYIGKSVLDLEYLSTEDRERYHNEDKRMIQNNTIVHYEVPFIFNDGKVHEALYWSSGFFDSKTGQKGLIGEIVDISNEKKLRVELQNSINQLADANKRIEENSRTDILTGIANRWVLEDQVPAILAMSRCHNIPCSILVADMDNFKLINDTYGHNIGDNVLKNLAKIIKQLCRKEDIPIRYGGEEFLIVLPMTRVSHAKAIAEKICRMISDKEILPDEVCVTVSIGVAQYNFKESLDELIMRGDRALYQAKESGKNKVVII